MIEAKVFQAINCTLLSFPQQTEEEFQYLIRKAYQVSFFKHFLV